MATTFYVSERSSYMRSQQISEYFHEIGDDCKRFGITNIKIFCHCKKQKHYPYSRVDCKHAMITLVTNFRF